MQTEQAEQERGTEQAEQDSKNTYSRTARTGQLV
jgi:hypothetical protein